MAKKKKARKQKPSSSNLACFRSGAFMCKTENYIEQAREATKRNDSVAAARFIGLAARQGIAAGRIMVNVVPSKKQASIKEKVERFRVEAESAFFTTKDLVIPKTLEVLEGLDDVRDELLRDVSINCGLRAKKKS